MTPTRTLAVFALLLAACGDSGTATSDTSEADTAVAEDTGAGDTGAEDTAVADTGAEDTAVADTGAEDTGAEDTAVADTGAEDTATADTTTSDVTEDTATADTETSDVTGDTVENDLGFTIRYPGTSTVTCESPIPEEPAQDVAMADADWLCTFDYGGSSGYVYTRATATGCYVTMSTSPIFGDCAGWIALDGAVSPVSETSYDWGGNHHNDSLTFTWDGKVFSYDHSSFGYGWRKCQEMDCLVVRSASGDLIEDGCTVNRTLPAVCRQIDPDGTWGSFEDTFAPCAGDPNYR